MNNVSLLGRATADVELSYTTGKNVIAVAHVTLAVDNPFSDNTDFIRLTAFGKTAEFMEKYIEKGKRVAVTGRIQTGSYEHKDGYTVYTTEVVVNQVYFADGKSDTPSEEPAQGKAGKGKNTQYSRR